MASLLSVKSVVGSGRWQQSARRAHDDRGEPTWHPRLVPLARPVSTGAGGALADPAELASRAAEGVARLSAALDAATASTFLHALRRGLLRETLDALIEDCERFATVIAPVAIEAGDSAALRTHARRMVAAVRTLDMSAEEGIRLPDTAHGVQRVLLRSALSDKDVQRAVAQLILLFTALADVVTIERPRSSAPVPPRSTLSRLGRPGSLVAGAFAALSLVTGGLAYGAWSSPATPMTGSLHGVRLLMLSSLARRAPQSISDRDLATDDGEERAER